MSTEAPKNTKYCIVTATRYDQSDFYSKSGLGRSIAVSYANDPSISLLVALNNSSGLPSVYNSAVDSIDTSDDIILIFAHDDIQLIDFDWTRKIAAALDGFGIVGLTGNSRRLPRQPSWAFVDTEGTWDKQENLSGTVGHGNGFPCYISRFGPAPRECKLLDGLLLGVRYRTLKDHDLRFDQRFDFHFYDLDFCRQAEAKGIRMGTVPLNLIHESFGNFSTGSWQAGYKTYLEKWGE